MDARRWVSEYLMLGLRMDVVSPGLVDSQIVDPLLRRRVARERPATPSGVLAGVDRLRDALDDVDFPPARREFLHAQLRALRCTARRLAGEPVSHRVELAECFQLTVEPGEPEEYRRIHTELDELLPGRGPLPDRWARLRRADRVPRDRLAECARALAGELRALTRRHVRLPASERVAIEIDHGRTWGGFHRYRGDFRSWVGINGDLAHRFATLPGLLAHEAYPGHHTESCRRDEVLVGSGQREHAITLVNTPRCVLSEGLAELGCEVLIGANWEVWAAEVYAGLGLSMPEPELVGRVERLVRSLRGVRQDAALLLHERGADEESVRAHLRRWLLLSDEQATVVLRFLTDPRWRCYAAIYGAGEQLVRSWLSVGPTWERFRRLLDEPLLPEQVRRESAALMSTVDSAGPECPTGGPG